MAKRRRGCSYEGYQSGTEDRYFALDVALGPHTDSDTAQRLLLDFENFRQC